MLTSCSDLRVFKCREEIGEESGRPEDIIIGKNRDRGPHFFKALDHLKPFVRFVSA